MSATDPKVALVTGAGSGIGRETATLLSAHGFTVVLLGREESKLRGTVARLKGPHRLHSCDVSDPRRLIEVIAATLAGFGHIDVLINNAGYAPSMNIDEHTPEILRRTFDTNSLAPAVAISRVWSAMQNAGGGRIINVSSMSAFDPFPGFFAYAASKAALNMLTKVAAKEGAVFGIRVFGIAPGAVETPMLRTIVSPGELPRERTLSPEQVAQVIVQCAMGERDAQSGETILLPSPQARDT